MKVLVFAGNDSDNIQVVNILRELERRGHILKIFSLHMDEHSIRMFSDFNTKVKNLRELNNKDIKWADCIFRAHPLEGVTFIGNSIFAEKYTYTYSPYLEDYWHTIGTEFLFSCSEYRRPDHYEDACIMPIGCPKNDTLKIKQDNLIHKTFLFIDSGHYPFSHIGRCKIAELLLKICREYPDYSLVVKPRFLPNDTNTLHTSNCDHLYHLLEKLSLGKLPKNLFLPQEHTDMQEMIDRSDCVLLMCSSAYVDVALRNKRMIIIKGVDNEDKFDLRNDIEFKNIYKLRDDSGCCIDINDVMDYLPEGLVCRNEHLNRIVKYRENVSQKIVEVMEYIFLNFLKKNIFPKIKLYNYENYKDEMKEDISLSWEELKKKRLKNLGNVTLNYFNRIVAEVNKEKYIAFIDEKYKNYLTNMDGYNSFKKDLSLLLDQLIIDNKDNLMKDANDQAVLLKALANREDFYIFFSLKEEILCPEVWHFCSGRIFSKEKEVDLSIANYVEYIKLCSVRKFAKYECEDWRGYKEAYFFIARNYNGKNITDEDFAIIFMEIFAKNLVEYISITELKAIYQKIPHIAKRLMDKKNCELAAKLMFLYVHHIKAIDESQNIITNYNEVRTSLSFRLGRVILAIPRKMYLDVQNIKINGFRNAFRRFVERRISTPLRNSPLFKINYFFHNQILEGYNEYKNIVLKNGIKRQYFLGDLGSGNIYLCGFFLEEYIAQSGIKENTYLLPERNCKEVAELFPMENINYCEIEHKSFAGLIRLLRFFNNSTINVVYLNYHHLWLNHTGILTYLERINGWNMFELYKAVFAEQINIKRKVPRIYEKNEEAYRIIHENGLKKGKTIIFAPYAGTYARISESFWEELAIRFRQRGYTVITLVDPEKEKAITGTNGVFVPYQVWGTFLEYSGGLVGLRSGLLDVSEDIKCKKVALYTTTRERFQNGDKSNLESFSINDMYERDDWLELKVRLTNQSKVLETILNYFEVE